MYTLRITSLRIPFKPITSTSVTGPNSNYSLSLTLERTLTYFREKCEMSWPVQSEVPLLLNGRATQKRMQRGGCRFETRISSDATPGLARLFSNHRSSPSSSSPHPARTDQNNCQEICTNKCGIQQFLFTEALQTQTAQSETNHLVRWSKVRRFNVRHGGVVWSHSTPQPLLLLSSVDLSQRPLRAALLYSPGDGAPRSISQHYSHTALHSVFPLCIVLCTISTCNTCLAVTLPSKKGVSSCWIQPEFATSFVLQICSISFHTQAVIALDISHMITLV